MSGGSSRSTIMQFGEEWRGIERKRPSLSPNACLTKGAINSSSGFLSFLGTPHPTPPSDSPFKNRALNHFVSFI